jgi:hypothetical protein
MASVYSTTDVTCGMSRANSRDAERVPEAAFVVSWYTVGILLPGLVGMLIGPRVLHW